MGKFIDLAGKKFGRWTVVQEAATSRSGHARWKCVCDCGVRGIVFSQSLRQGHSKSCGCFHREAAAARARRHGMYGTPTYVSWYAMLSRCLNAKQERFTDYGGRGIRVCARWRQSFAAFYADMGVRPRGKTLDRRDNDGNYSKRNCRWADASTQVRNRRR